MKSVIVGTAGHIDHGKTSLVRALTGVDADRLPEEKQRGITIDIGFAELDLGDVRIGFVDVPGHERFVKNMLAGAHGIDVVVLVIAADEGVMPQTREHFDVCRLLGVKAGLIALTKIDAAEAELLPLVRAEVEELVRGSFLENAPLVEVSALGGAGLGELREQLRAAALAVPPRAGDCLARLPIDRAFSMRGFGAVVTGTLIADKITEGGELDRLPAGGRVRVRGVQVHGRAVQSAEAGQRTALNLGGVEVSDLERGMVLAAPGRLRATQTIDAHLEMLPTAPRPLRSRARLRVHLGTAEVLARVQVLEESEIKQGTSGLVQLRLEAPTIAVFADRFIIRSYSPAHTIAGGQVLDNAARRYRGREKTVARERLAKLMRAQTNGQRLALLAAEAGERALSREDTVARMAWRDEALGRAVAEAKKAQAIVEIENYYLTQESLDNLVAEAVRVVKKYHQQEPLARGLNRETLRERVFATTPPEIFRAALIAAEHAGHIVSERDIVRAAEHSLTLSETDAQLQNQLEEIYRTARLEAPATEEALAKALKQEPRSTAHHDRARKIMQLLINSGTLVRVGDFFFHHDALQDLIERLRAYAAQPNSNRTIDIAAFKTLSGVSRKYAIPLLEHLDRTRVTRRAGENRLIL